MTHLRDKTNLHRIFCFLALLVACSSFAGTAAAHDPGEDMADAAARFVKSLDDEAKSAAVFDYDNDLRTKWNFLPDKFIPGDKKRFGLSLKNMTQQQRALAQGLLATGLSHRGYLQTMTIVSLETILFELEKQPFRDSGLYYVSIFGEPAADGTWSWRFEGHHLSINVSIVKGKLFALTPSFFGANPGKVQQGPFEGLQVLRDEEELARSLVNSLSEEQRKIAIVATDAPADVITKWDRRVDRGKFKNITGIRLDQLNTDQQPQLKMLIKNFTGKYRKELVDNIDARKQLFDAKEITFAWAGSTEPDQGHYYCIQTPLFLFEYDNTQSNANHVHAVWRDVQGDFGEDLLREHYEASHRKGK